MENNTHLKVAITKKVGETEFWKPVHIYPALQRNHQCLTTKCQMYSRVFFQEMLPYQYLYGTEDDIRDNTDMEESASNVKV